MAKVGKCAVVAAAGGTRRRSRVTTLFGRLSPTGSYDYKTNTSVFVVLSAVDRCWFYCGAIRIAGAGLSDASLG